MRRIVVLDDAETWSGAAGCKMLDVPDEWTSEQITETLAGDGSREWLARICQIRKIVEFSMLADNNDEYLERWRRHLIAGLLLLQTAANNRTQEYQALNAAEAMVEASGGRLDSLADPGQIDAWICSLQRKAPASTEEQRELIRRVTEGQQDGE